MVMSLTPVVYRGQYGRWSGGALLHVVGGAAGGAMTGVALTPLTIIPVPRALWLAVGASLVFATLGDLGITRRLYPSSRFQVPERWRKVLPADLVFFLYGIGLGAAFFTRVATSALFACIALALASTQPALLVASLAAFGATRSLAAVSLAGVPQSYSRTVDLADALIDRFHHARFIGGIAVTLVVTAYVAEKVLVA